MRSRSAVLCMLLGAVWLGVPSSASAEGASTAVRVSPGKRSIPASEAETSASSSKPLPLSELPEAKEDSSKKKSHKKGGKPRTPKARLPEGVALSQPNAKARHSIAGGPTPEELKEGALDEELVALRKAEKVLFPRRVRGLRSSWSFDLPEEEDQSTRTLGLPLVVGNDAEGPGVSSEDIAWLKTLTLPDLPVRLDRRVVTYLKFYRDSHRGRTIAAIWTRKSGRYVAEMKAKLRRAGLPTDLVWLSMIESGHNPTIKSPAGAMGLWQFMPESGRMYGLTVDRWVDERRDPARATQAAIRFLGDLYRRFGNWELAMGAYNMGYAGMSRAVAKYNTNDYWVLSRMESGIPWETTLYVPKIFALAIVMNNREAFGVGRTKLDPAETFDTIYVGPATPLQEAADAAGTSLAQLRRLNPSYVASRIPPQKAGELRKWPLRLPKGTAEKALGKLAKKAGAAPHRTLVVRLGDTESSLSASYGVTKTALRKENGLRSGEALRPGTVLVLPASAKKSAETAPVHVVVSRKLAPGPGQRRVFYRVNSRDRLDELAAALGVSESDLARWNALSMSAHLRSGMVLQALVPEKTNLDHVRHVEEKGVRVLLAGSSEFHEHFEGLKGKKRVQVTVMKGDTLVKVGRKYGMSVGSMERVNRRSRRTALIAGERLIVYTDKKVSSQVGPGSTAALPPIEAPVPSALP